MINDNYPPGKHQHPIISLSFISIYFFLLRMYQLEKEEGSEFGASIVPGDPSKMSLTAQQIVKGNFY